MMRKIIGVHFPDIHDDLMDNAIAAFYHMRDWRPWKNGRPPVS
jgi:hypothetical protein